MGAPGKHAGPELTRATLGDRTTLRKHSVRIAGHPTSISLENAFWEALNTLARDADIPLAQLIERIDVGRGTNLSSAIRVFVLERYRMAASAPSVAAAGIKEG